MHRKTKKITIWAFLLIVISYGSVKLMDLYLHSLQTLNDKPYTFVVRKGTSFKDLSRILQEHHVIHFPQIFYGVGRLSRIVLQSGEYQIEPHMKLQELIEVFRNPKPVIRLFTVVEGSTPHKITHDLNQAWRLQGAKLTQDKVVLAETYDYVYGHSRKKLQNRMHKALLHKATELWQHASCHDVIPSVEAFIILASIVEKETALAAERPRIAGVFLNRLRKGMPLQADCTVSYGLHMHNQRPLNQALSRAELQEATPFNTYILKGLPPQPICNPGLASLQAIVHPHMTADLYYVADGTGGHVFTSSSKEHVKNHREWRKIRKKQKQAKP